MTHDGTPSLFSLIDDDDPVAIHAALVAGMDVDERDESDSFRTPLMLAAKEGGPHAVRLLLAAGAQVGLQDENGWSALHHLAGADEPDMESLSLLLAAGADPDDIAGTKVPMGVADFDDDEEAPEDDETTATQEKADDPLAQAETPMVVAASFGQPDILRRLLDAGGTPRAEQLRASLSNGVSECTRVLMPLMPDITLAEVLAAWPSEPFPAEARQAFEALLAKRDASALDGRLPGGPKDAAPGRRGPRL